tara:strand:+ start:1399 stop:1833 length:435 start_codon:yes stop_codon:yes gene_type:complete
MKNFKLLILLFIFYLIYPQSNSISKAPFFKHKNLLGVWAFESMTTIRHAKRKEITILYKDKKNIETLQFETSGAIKYNVLNDGIKKNGNGIWFADDSHLTIIVESDTTYGTFSIDESMLTLVIDAEETNKLYGYSTIIKYIRKY